MTFRPMTDEDRAAVEKIAEQLEALDAATGGWDYKADARQTGASVHFTFGNKVDVMTVTTMFVGVVNRAPGLLANCCARLLAADDERRAAEVSS